MIGPPSIAQPPLRGGSGDGWQRLGRDRGRVDDRAQHAVRGCAAQASLVAKDEPGGQDGLDQTLYVVGDHKGSTAQRGLGLGGPEQREACPWAGTELD